MKYQKLTYDTTRPMSHVITVPAESDWGVAVRLTRNGESLEPLTASIGGLGNQSNVNSWLLFANDERKPRGSETLDVEIVESYDTMDMTLDTSFTLSNDMPFEMDSSHVQELGDVLPQHETVRTAWIQEPIVMGVKYDQQGGVVKAGDFVDIDPSNRIILSGLAQGTIGECKKSYGGWKFGVDEFDTDDTFALIWRIHNVAMGKTSVEGVIPIKSGDGKTHLFKLDVNRDNGTDYIETKDR